MTWNQEMFAQNRFRTSLKLVQVKVKVHTYDKSTQFMNLSN